MNEKSISHKDYQSANLMTLIVYTVFAGLLVVETFGFGWERWPLWLIAVGLIISWWMHFAQILPDRFRLYFYFILSLIVSFLFAVHEEGGFNIAPLIVLTMCISIITGERRMAFLTLLTFLLETAYSIVGFFQRGEEIQTFRVMRTIFSVVLVFLAWFLVRFIIRRFERIFGNVEEQVGVLQDATRRMDDFLANVSHEIRTPVNAVIGLTSIMLDKNLDPDVKKDLRSVVEAGYRVTEQISDILDYTEIDMGKLAVSNETYMISSMIQDLSVQLRRHTYGDAYVMFDVDPQIPAALVGDVAKIRKIIWHLVTNGIKFATEGKCVVYVRIHAIPRPYGVNLCIQVSDTGAGMTPHQIERAYDMFNQADSSRSRRTGGLGLGLKIVHGMVQAMRGFLTVESEPGKGTTIRISLPQRIVDPTPCVVLPERAEYRMAVFLKYSQLWEPRVRLFYRTMLDHLAENLGVPLFSVESIEDLDRLRKNNRLTHLFIGYREYESPEEIAYMDALAREICVIHFAAESVPLKEGSRVKMLMRPVSTFSIAAILNQAQDAETGVDADSDEKLYCPGIRALVVDDERMNLMVAMGIFKNYGMIITTASSGPEAIALCEKEEFDLIFMDHMMPEMDGVETMKRIRALAGAGGTVNQVIVALTANTVSSAKEMFLAEGFNGFIAKPIELSELERVLKRVLPKSAFRDAPSPVEAETKPAEPSPAEAETKPAREAVPEPEPDGPFAPLEAIGVDPEVGLRYCQNETDFYLQLLEEYGQSAGEKLSELRRFYEAQDWKNYTIRVHAVKSTSKMIGAEDLSERARKLEAAAKAEQGDAVAEGHEEMMALYDATAEACLLVCGLDPSARGSGDEELLEFLPDGSEDAQDGDDHEILEFLPERPAENASGDSDSEILEFLPEE